ncbi:MAG TPA: hypothetical protein PKU74_02925, partial [Candidatus Omnitrophota bacterium]|nr:hypothetical protein [Candidatus Omnitrophota bacterium]
MNIKKVLLLYKKSTFKHHFQKHRLTSSLSPTERVFVSRFKRTHDVHYKNLDIVVRVLKSRGVIFDMIPRGQSADYR